MELLSDQERQNDELFALECIDIADEFKYKRNSDSRFECSFSLRCKLVKNNIEIFQNFHQTLQSECADQHFGHVLKDENDNIIHSDEPSETSKGEKNIIRYLPPVRLYVQLPSNYPSVSCPMFNLAINWLAPWVVSIVCQKLDDMWTANEYSEILYTWIDFLKYELLNFLNIIDYIDVSYLYGLFLMPENDDLLDLMKIKDRRIIYGGLFLDPIEKLLENNRLCDHEEFKSNKHECSICFIENKGTESLKMEPCNHIYCEKCMEEYLIVKINQRDIQNITCPTMNCLIIINSNIIKQYCPPESYDKYEQCLYELQLSKQGKVVHCPRKFCQNLVLVVEEDGLASCKACQHHFCAFCFKTYHGVMPCDMKNQEKLKLIQEYQNGDYKKKKYLEKIHGRKQIKEIVENQLSTDYLKERTKKCPTCGILTAKVSGCNLLNCSYCYTKFCWICNCKIVIKDGYDHFKSTSIGACKGRLFDDVDEYEDFHEDSSEYDEFESDYSDDNLDALDDFELEENLTYFHEETELKI
ncbi:E3 ubiquitin-protein ligase RNF14-like [Trichogramma pretiosum]|uniref:E3 ubiquitin-protein ligase RNF14-like n=1 Tax=Trichogramma pretiosum TaxID=7493 RepID=UPI000C71A964|nr:E3 ubiquitin-protein ligase RNF14-like [Trichogramma pretiosum]